MSADLEGRVMLLTGATEGIGRAAALALAARGATLVLVGRNAEKTARVVDEARKAGGGDRVDSILADLSTKAGMNSAADRFLEKHSRLDVLVNNAGGVFTEHRKTVDGFELTFALNHLAYFVLTQRLRGVLEKTPGARVVSTSSGAHRGASLDLDTVATRPRGDAGFRAYSDSKLANILFTRELGRRLAGTGVVAHCYHPGFVHTGFALNNGGAVAWAVKLFAPLFARTPEKGAETLVWLATSPEATQHQGEYFHDRRIASTSRAAKDDALARGLWALSERLAG